MDFVWDVLKDVIHDTWLMIPLLYLCYCLIEYFERRDGDDSPLFFALQKYGPLFGAVLGLLPQCGFSILAAMLYLQQNVTLGTMVAVFIATSDEAIPVLLSNPALLPDLLWILGLKFVLAAFVGYLTDFLFSRKKKIVRFEDMPEEEEEEELEEDSQEASSCPCCYPDLPLWESAGIRTLKIYGWIFLVSVLFTVLVELVGEETLGKFLLSGTWYQPVLAALVGFIPNCAATVVLAELFSFGELSFGSLFAGLVTNAGLGLMVLFQYGAKKKTLVRVFAILFVTAVLAGLGLQLF